MEAPCHLRSCSITCNSDSIPRKSCSGYASNLLQLRVKGEISREEFEEANDVYREKILEMEDRLRACASDRATADSFVRFAELQVMDMAKVWRMANPEQRERVQNLLFQGGLDYSPEFGFLNPSMYSLFYNLKTVDLKNKGLVEAAGVEPAVNTENTQVTETETSGNVPNSTIT